MSAPCLPAEMPDVRVRLIENWSRPAWQNQALGGIERAERNLGRPRAEVRSVEEQAAAYIGWEIRTLRNAELWWVGEDMCDLLYHARPTVPDDVTLASLTPPSDSGFVVFERPWLSIDAADANHLVTVDAIAWGWAVVQPYVEGDDPLVCLSVSSYRLLDFAAGLDGGELELAARTGAWAEGRRGRLGADGEGRVAWSMTGKVWAPLGRGDWPSGHTLRQPIVTTAWNVSTDAEVPSFEASVIEDRQLIAALWTLLGSHAARTETEPIDRASRRRGERAGVTAPAAVKLVYLRRPEKPDEDDDEATSSRRVNWSHRWMVSAHLRNQPCGPGRRERRLVLIAPYVKGPEEKPLVVKESVKVWVR